MVTETAGECLTGPRIGPGMRTPLVAPFGRDYVAWSSSDSQKAWLEAIGQPSPALRKRMTAVLKEIRHRGFVVERLTPRVRPRLHRSASPQWGRRSRHDHHSTGPGIRRPRDHRLSTRRTRGQAPPIGSPPSQRRSPMLMARSPCRSPPRPSPPWTAKLSDPSASRFAAPRTASSNTSPAMATPPLSDWNSQMSTIAQVRIHAPGEVNLDRVDLPPCGPRDAIVDVHACGICGSDLSYIRLGGLAGPSGEPMRTRPRTGRRSTDGWHRGHRRRAER